MKVAVIGSGYVGLVTGVCLAEKGHSVVCADKDARIVSAILAGKSPIHEPGLDEMLARNLASGALSATTDVVASLEGAEIVFIAVGTPFGGKEIDLTYVKAVCQELGGWLGKVSGFPVIITKSTVIPTTAETVILPLLETESGRKAGMDFGLCSNPEFLREGSAVGDFLNPDRIIIGGTDARSFEKVKRLYEWASCPVLETNLRTAEMIKYTSNAFLPMLISFSNEIANLCWDVGGVDVCDVIKGLRLDFRLNPVAGGERVNPGILSYLDAGCGYGGSCFPKDVKAFIAFSEKYNAPLRVVKQVAEANARQPLRIIEMLEQAVGSVAGKTVAVLGLAFKPDTDDTRESPAIPIIRELKGRGARVVAHDPVVKGEFDAVAGCGALDHAPDWRTAVKGAHAAIIVTKWSQYAEISDAGLSALMADPVLVDTRRLLSRDAFKKTKYVGTGFRSIPGTGG